MYLEILKAGNAIIVKHPTNGDYEPTRFEIKDGKINYFNNEIGSGEHPTIQTERELKRHFNNMLKSGFKLEIINKN